MSSGVASEERLPSFPTSHHCALLAPFMRLAREHRGAAVAVVAFSTSFPRPASLSLRSKPQRACVAGSCRCSSSRHWHRYRYSHSRHRRTHRRHSLSSSGLPTPYSRGHSVQSGHRRRLQSGLGHREHCWEYRDHHHGNQQDHRDEREDHRRRGEEEDRRGPREEEGLRVQAQEEDQPSQEAGQQGQEGPARAGGGGGPNASAAFGAMTGAPSMALADRVRSVLRNIGCLLRSKCRTSVTGSYGSGGRSSVKSRVRPLHLAHGPIPQGVDAAARARRSGLAALRQSRALAYGHVRFRGSCAWLSRGVQDTVLPPAGSFP
jgi:hypothetical protein